MPANKSVLPGAIHNGLGSISQRWEEVHAKSLDAPLSKTLHVDASSAMAGIRGTTQAYPTIQAAVADLQAGDTIKVIPGDYFWSSITIGVANVTIIAYGATFTKSTKAATHISVTASGFRIYGASFNGARGASTGNFFFYPFIHPQMANDAVIEDCRFVSNAGVAIRADGGDNLQIRGCYFADNSHDLFPQDTTKTRIIDNRFAGNINSDVFSGAIKIKTTGVVNNAEHVVSGNNISGPGEMGVEAFGAMRGGMISNNTINGTSFGVSVGAYANNWLVSNNYLKANYFTAIEFAANANHCTAIDNHIDGLNDAGVLTTGTHAAGSAISMTVDASDINIIGGTINQYGRYAANLFGGIHRVSIRGVRIKPNAAQAGTFAVYNCNDIVFEDNIIAAPDSGSINVPFAFAAENGTYGGYVVRGNTVYADLSLAYINFAVLAGGSFGSAIVQNNYAEGTLAAALMGGTPSPLVQDGNYPTGGTGFAVDATIGTRSVITFTPGATGWYRLLDYDGGELSGRMTIRDNTSTTGTAWDIFFTTSAWGNNSSLLQASGLNSWYGPVSVTEVRAGRNGGLTALEVYVATVPDGPITVYFEDTNSVAHAAKVAAAIDATPAHNPSTTGWTFTTLTLVPNRINHSTGYAVGGNQVVGARGSAIADDASGAVNQATVNAILTAMRNHGLIAV